MNYLVIITFGILPSIIWLLYYLREDVHPEPKRMILKIFCYGVLIGFVAIAVELSISGILQKIKGAIITPSFIFFYLIQHFVAVALVEEVLKYSVVRLAVLKSPEFDEPTDAMIYMIITALGFAALENILTLCALAGAENFLSGAAIVTALRFLGATFLHCLCSATIGFFVAWSIYEPKNKHLLIGLGLLIAVLLHGLFNLFIINIEGLKLSILAIGFILMSLAIFVSFAFRKLKKIASVCEIDKE